MQSLSDLEKRYESENWTSRSGAVNACEQLELQEALTLLAVAVKDPHKYVRQKAIEVMRHIKRPECRPLLEFCLLDEYHYNRRLAFQGLVLIYSEDMRDVLTNAINRNVELPEEKAYMLWYLKDTKDAFFVPLIQKNIPKISRANKTGTYILLELIRVFPNPMLISEIMAYTKLPKQDASSKSQIVEMLGLLKAREGLDFILNHAGHRFSPGNFSDDTCFRALVEMDAADLFFEKLPNYRARKKNLLIEAIGKLGYIPAKESFIKQLAAAKNIDLRIALAKALSDLNYEAADAENQLLFAIAKENWDTAEHISNRSRRFEDLIASRDTTVQDRDIIDKLLAAISKSYRPALSKLAIICLGNRDAVQYTDVLIKNIQTKDNYKRILSIEALGKIGTTEAAEALLDYLYSNAKTEPPFDVGREKAIRAIGKIKAESTYTKFLALLSDTYKPGRNKALLIKNLGDWGKKEAIPAILETLPDNDQYVRAASLKALEQLEWKVGSIREQIFYFSAQGFWEEIVKLGLPAIDALCLLTKDTKSWAYEKWMLALAKIGDATIMDYILEWLFRPHFSLHSTDEVEKIRPFLEPLFGDWTVTVLEAAAYIDCVIKEDGRSTHYSYALNTAIAATKRLSAAKKDSLAQKILACISRKKPVQLIDSEHEEYGGGYLTFDFKEQIKML